MAVIHKLLYLVQFAFIYKYKCDHHTHKDVNINCTISMVYCFYRNTPEGFSAYWSSGNNNSCLYQSISLHLRGDELLQLRLRLAASIHAIRYMGKFIKEVCCLLCLPPSGGDILFLPCLSVCPSVRLSHFVSAQ